MTNGQSGFTLGIVKASPIDPTVPDRSFSGWGKFIEMLCDIVVLLPDYRICDRAICVFVFGC